MLDNISSIFVNIGTIFVQYLQYLQQQKIQYHTTFGRYLHNIYTIIQQYFQRKNCAKFDQYLCTYFHKICTICTQYLYNICTIFDEYLILVYLYAGKQKLSLLNE